MSLCEVMVAGIQNVNVHSGDLISLRFTLRGAEKWLAKQRVERLKTGSSAHWDWPIAEHHVVNASYIEHPKGLVLLTDKYEDGARIVRFEVSDSRESPFRVSLKVKVGNADHVVTEQVLTVVNLNVDRKQDLEEPHQIVITEGSAHIAVVVGEEQPVSAKRPLKIKVGDFVDVALVRPALSLGSLQGYGIRIKNFDLFQDFGENSGTFIRSRGGDWVAHTGTIRLRAIRPGTAIIDNSMYGVSEGLQPVDLGNRQWIDYPAPPVVSLRLPIEIE